LGPSSETHQIVGIGCVIADGLLLCNELYSLSIFEGKSKKLLPPESKADSYQILIGACGEDQKAAIPGEFSFTSRLIEALRILSNNFQSGLWATALYIYVDSMMKQLPNPWFPQNSQIKLFAGTGDIWLEHMSDGVNLNLEYHPAQPFRKVCGRQGRR